MGETLECSPDMKYKNPMTLKAIIHKAEEGGFWAEVPALPGCLTQAETLDELKANLREAIELWLSVDDEVTESNAGDKVMELTV
jgi:predicted RNase H-like HicB family nuclease